MKSITNMIVENMTLKNSVYDNVDEVIFLNSMALAEYEEIIKDIVVNMIEDLSIITGLSEYEILENYIALNRESVFETILRKQGKPMKKINWVLRAMGR